MRLTALGESLRDGLWLIPILAIATAMAIATVLMVVDRTWPDLPSAFHGDASSAQDLLSTIATSTVTVTTLVLSITIVALQLASQQFSPRVMRTFFRDRGTKFSLGIFLATAVYALFVLRAVVPRGQGRSEFVPGESISVAFALAVTALVTFVYYLNHVSHAIRVVHIIEAVAHETGAVIDDLPAPDEGDQGGHDLDGATARSDNTSGSGDGVGAGGWPQRAADAVLCSDQPAGVLIVIDEDDFVDLARRCRVRIGFLRRVGDYLPRGLPLAEVWSDDGGPVELETGELLRYTGIGRERTMSQDAAFGFRQLVDIAEKALSPALNDPTTAVQCIDRLHDLLRRLAVRPDADGVYRDGDGQVRLVVPQYGWEDYVRLAFDEIRHYGAGSVQVHQRLRATIEDLLTVVTGEPQRIEALAAQSQMLDRSAAVNFADDQDRQRASTPHLAG